MTSEPMRDALQGSASPGHAMRGLVPFPSVAANRDSRCDIVGRGPALMRAVKLAEIVAPTAATVLITGETGTGKELIARTIHRLSPRRANDMVTVNCAALPAGLIESELFGHERGAFTGAVARKIGRFELAHGGTIFLDEVGELPPELQAKLLRVLQEGEFERVGSTQPLHVSARVIAATNQDLERAIRDGRFRPDLYFRLNVFPIPMPPLRDRKDDLPELVAHLVGKLSRKLEKRIDTVPSATLDALRAYSWPGNVRELENVLERALILSDGSELHLGHWARTRATAGATPFATLQEMERRYIEDVLQHTGWVVSGVTGAARVLGLKASTLEARMRKLGIVRPRC